MRLPFVLRSSFDSVCDQLTNMETAYTELLKDRNTLRLQLKEASKNDQRDPLTGKFTKAG